MGFLFPRWPTPFVRHDKIVTWASEFFEVRETAPALTTSDNWTIVLTAFWAATANCSWLDAAPVTRAFVSSTRALAVFRIASLNRLIKEKKYSSFQVWKGWSNNRGLQWCAFRQIRNPTRYCKVPHISPTPEYKAAQSFTKFFLS